MTRVPVSPQPLPRAPVLLFPPWLHWNTNQSPLVGHNPQTFTCCCPGSDPHLQEPWGVSSKHTLGLGRRGPWDTANQQSELRWDHRMGWVRMDLKDYLIPVPAMGHLPQDQAAQSPIRPGLSTSRDETAMNSLDSTSKSNLSYILFPMFYRESFYKSQYGKILLQ